MTTQVTLPVNALHPLETLPFTALTFTTRATHETLVEHALPVGQRLAQEAGRLGLPVSGPIQWIYTGVTSDEANEFQLEIALPVYLTREQTPGEELEEFSLKTFPAVRCMGFTHRGSWDDFGQLYDQLFEQLYRDGYRSDGRVREIYSVVDVDKPRNCVTEIQLVLA